MKIENLPWLHYRYGSMYFGEVVGGGSHAVAVSVQAGPGFQCSGPSLEDSELVELGLNGPERHVLDPELKKLGWKHRPEGSYVFWKVPKVEVERLVDLLVDRYGEPRIQTEGVNHRFQHMMLNSILEGLGAFEEVEDDG